MNIPSFDIGFGGSMLPTIGRFGIIVYRKFDHYSVGDIVVFKGNNKWRYSHRIVSIDDQKFTTKGDNHESSEPYEIDVPVSNIIGKITWWFP